MDQPQSDVLPRQALEDILDRFEQAWQAGEAPRIEDFLNEAANGRQTLLRELVHTDLELRFQAGQKARVEDYLERFPELASLIDPLIDLILAEYRFRCHQGNNPPVEEFQQRFPQLGSALAAKLGELADKTVNWEAEEQQTPADLPAQVGRYRIEREIDRGGMGVILRVQDEGFRRPLAMKVLLAPTTERTGLVDRFLKEATLTGCLQHPGIPPVHDLGELPDGRPYFVMKLIRGRSLQDLLRERTSPDQDRPRFVGIFEQICQTLAYTHAQGIIHRDLKPANIMVGAFGEVQVMDWGLAKLLARSGGENDPGTES